MQHNSCFEEGEKSSLAFHDAEKTPYHLLTPTADNVLLDTANHEAYFGWLEGNARSYYYATGMHKKFPERAEMLVARWVNNAGQVVVKALADEILMRRFIGMKEQSELLLPYSIPRPLYVEGAGHRQFGEYDRFLQTMTAQYMGALAAVFCRVQENGEHKGLWETLEAQQQVYSDAWKEYRYEAEQRGMIELNPPYEPFSSANDTTVGGIGNNMLTTQSVLLAYQRYFEERWDPESGEPYTAFIRRTALAHTALLALPASTNRRATADILPDPPAITAEDGNLVCVDPLSYAEAPCSFTTDKNGVERWATRRLKGNERWRVPGHCAGDVPHRPTLQGEETVDRFFEKISMYAGGVELGRDENGRFRSVEVLLSIGQLVAELTMYRNRAQ